MVAWCVRFVYVACALASCRCASPSYATSGLRTDVVFDAAVPPSDGRRATTADARRSGAASYALALPWQNVTVHTDVPPSGRDELNRRIRWSTAAARKTLAKMLPRSFDLDRGSAAAVPVTPLQLLVFKDAPAFERAVRYGGYCGVHKHTAGPGGKHASEIYVRYDDGRCTNFNKTLVHEYTHYMDFMVIRDRDRLPYWWTEGLATYVAGACRRDGLAAAAALPRLFDDATLNAYDAGEIIHGFLDSAPALRRMHDDMTAALVRSDAVSFRRICREAVQRYARGFDGQYCRRFDHYDVDAETPSPTQPTRQTLPTQPTRQTPPTRPTQQTPPTRPIPPAQPTRVPWLYTVCSNLRQQFNFTTNFCNFYLQQFG